MKGYIDTHCHLLPGVDDGADSLEETKEMLKTACREGIRTIIATPHYHIGHCTAEVPELKKRFRQAQEAAREINADFKLYLGTELYYHYDAPAGLENGEILTMAGSSYVLTEFPPRQEFSAMREGLKRLQLSGYTPVLAHAERYECLYGKTDLAESLTDMGCLLQVNASAVVGGQGGRTKRFIRKLMKEGWVHLVGTDAHGSTSRAPLMRECALYLEKKYGKEYAEQLLLTNPLKIIRNEYL